MSTSSPPADAASNENDTQRPYSQIAAQHIRELANINSQTPTLLLHAAQSISLLTNHPLQRTSNPTDLSTPAARAAHIRTLTHSTFLLLNQIRKLLKDQVDLLESSSVIPSEPTRYIAPFKPPPTDMRLSQAQQAQQGRQKELEYNPEAGVTNNGLGDFSVADLNARAGVRQKGDEDLLKRLGKILEVLEGHVGGVTAPKAEGGEEEDGEEEMVDV